MIRRIDDAIDFNVSYNTYKSPIGHETAGSYWMGLSTMHALTSPCPASVRMELLDSSGTQHFTYFKECFVGPRSEEYGARFIGSTTVLPIGPMGHCNSLHRSITRFSARDHGVSQDRAQHGGWWWAASGGNALTIPFSSLQCPSAVFPDLVKVEIVLLTRDRQGCNY